MPEYYPDIGEVVSKEQDSAVLAEVKTGVEVEADNPTCKKIQELINKDPKHRVPFSEFMGESLNAYYGKIVKLGIHREDAHFDTSPEVSTYFGFPFAQLAYDTWNSLGKPETFDLIEIGAGRGRLAGQILDWIDDVGDEGFKASVRYKIVELSPTLIDQQKAGLIDREVEWVQGSATQFPLGGIDGMILSNELPDAFPVERVKRIDDMHLAQCFVTIRDGKWVEVWQEPTSEITNFINKYDVKIVNGIEMPINILAESFQQQINKALRKGVVVTIDYGLSDIGNQGKSCIRTYGDGINSQEEAEKVTNIYKNVGKRDMTSDVDFRILEIICKEDGLSIDLFDKQTNFILRSGLVEKIAQQKTKIKESRSWDELVDFSREMQAYRELMRISERRFRSLVISRGVNLPVKWQTESLVGEKETIIPSIYVDMEEQLEPFSIYILQNKSGKRLRKIETGDMVLLQLAPHEIADGVLIREPYSSKIIADLSTPEFIESQKKVLEAKTSDEWENAVWWRSRRG